MVGGALKLHAGAQVKATPYEPGATEPAQPAAKPPAEPGKKDAAPAAAKK